MPPCIDAQPPCGSVDGALWFERRPGCLFAGSPLFVAHREALVDGATRAQLPVTCEERAFAAQSENFPVDLAPRDSGRRVIRQWSGPRLRRPRPLEEDTT